MEYFNNIMLVDDDPTVNFLSRFWINESKLATNILTYTNPEKALDFIKQNCVHVNLENRLPDLLLLDINMPRMDGFELLDKLMEIPALRKKRALVFMLSSSNDPQDIEKAKQYPLAGYLVKPLSQENIQRIIQTLLVTG